MKPEPAPLRPAQPLEITIIPDAMGAEMLRQIADAIEAHVDKESHAGGIVELPVGMPDRLDPESIADLADAINATSALDVSGAHSLDFDFVWLTVKTFLHFGAATSPHVLMDILAENDQGGYSVARVASGQRPAFGFKPLTLMSVGSDAVPPGRTRFGSPG